MSTPSIKNCIYIIKEGVMMINDFVEKWCEVFDPGSIWFPKCEHKFEYKCKFKKNKWECKWKCEHKCKCKCKCKK